jgi:hypothetical protein
MAIEQYPASGNRLGQFLNVFGYTLALPRGSRKAGSRSECWNALLELTIAELNSLATSSAVPTSPDDYGQLGRLPAISCAANEVVAERQISRCSLRRQHVCTRTAPAGD